MRYFQLSKKKKKSPASILKFTASVLYVLFLFFTLLLTEVVHLPLFLFPLPLPRFYSKIFFHSSSLVSLHHLFLDLAFHSYFCCTPSLPFVLFFQHHNFFSFTFFICSLSLHTYCDLALAPYLSLPCLHHEISLSRQYSFHTAIIITNNSGNELTRAY